MIERKLYIGIMPKVRSDAHVVALTSQADIDTLVEMHAHSVKKRPLHIDARALDSVGFNALLIFVEKYEESITLIAEERFPPPFLSRFTQVFKEQTPVVGTMIDLRLRGVGEIMMEKIKTLFGSSNDENQDF